ANCSAPMGEAMFRGYSEFDAVVVGPGEIAFPRLVRELQKGRQNIRIPGVYWRGTAEDTAPPDDPGVAPEPAMDDLPLPNYDDYFAHWPEGEPSLMVPFEGSRGCWWGQKHHCTFCGLNGGTIAFRTKPAARALEEVEQLHRRYGARAGQLAATDNIMPVDYPRSFVPRLAALELDTPVFYEVKANLGRRELEALCDAGIVRIQPGIESLSTPVLRLMDKGVTALQNIQLLKWARQYEVDVQWNVLYALPAERPEHYEGQVELWEKLHHLPAPLVCGPIRIDRFSPHFERPHDHGIADLRPHPSYRWLYPDLDPRALEGVAYSFVGRYRSQGHTHAYAEPLCAAVQRWKERAASTALVMLDGPGGLAIGALGPDAAPWFGRLRGDARAAYLACDRITGEAALRRALARQGGRDVSPEQLRCVVAPLLERGLMLEEDGRYLSLAIDLNASTPRGRSYVLPIEHWPHLRTLMALADDEEDVTCPLAS
ncbi:MAG: RiPP maturation radical SAM C-methyltransferase, partial [Myxococcales bacterium]|nr:RiPP maturation radical SAM C-methyltransferase [Myxococcales bacterium]